MKGVTYTQLLNNEFLVSAAVIRGKGRKSSDNSAARTQVPAFGKNARRINKHLMIISTGLYLIQLSERGLELDCPLSLRVHIKSLY